MRFFSNSTLLNGSESGGGLAPARFFASSGPAIPKSTQRGKGKKVPRETGEPLTAVAQLTNWGNGKVSFMKTKTSPSTNSMKRPPLWRNQYAARSSINPVVEDVMGCGTAYPTCRSGSRARAVSIKRGWRRKETRRLWRILELSLLVSVALLFSSQLAVAQFSQQGSKLVGTGVSGLESGQGCCGSVSLSSDGNTAIVGGPFDDGDKGAVWVYTRSGGVWTQQGSKLVGTGAIGIAGQGDSVSISSDGNTAIVGGPSDDGDKGTVWVYTRSNGVWTQQGNKLVGTGAIGSAEQGSSVSISSDGNTAIIGGPGDNGSKGAAWVFTRSGGVWTQQGSKLVGTGAIGIAGQGGAVSLSSDGNTAIIGGSVDKDWAGAAWVFTRSGGVWTQQGSKLVGAGAIGTVAQQGLSVSISSDGNTAIVGGPTDDYPGKGAAWVYTRSGGAWSQQGNKLVGAGAIGFAPGQGSSVWISSDGNTVIIGGPGDDGDKGAAWVFTRSGGVWTQQGNKLVGTGAIGIAGQGGAVSLSSDGNTAIVGGPVDDGWKGAAWVYVRQKHPKEPPGANYRAIDPMALILKGKWLDIWYEIHHPHVGEIQQVLRSMTPQEQKEVLNRARILESYAKAEQKMLRSMTPEEQKAALNRAKTLENYGKAVEEAFATMKK
jgi:hypothetical protein